MVWKPDVPTCVVTSWALGTACRVAPFAMGSPTASACGVVTGTGATGGWFAATADPWLPDGVAASGAGAATPSGDSTKPAFTGVGLSGVPDGCWAAWTKGATGEWLAEESWPRSSDAKPADEPLLSPWLPGRRVLRAA